MVLSTARGGVCTKTRMRLDDYIPVLLDKRKHEGRKKDEIYETSDGITSPSGATSFQEIRIFSDYMKQANLLKITEAAPEKKNFLMMKRFFNMKRNQQVVIYSKSGDETIQTLGKVSAIGRDYVMVTNLNERIWLPYHSIDSANIPTGIPNFSNSHQYLIFDNDLRRKLLYNFGETVAKRDVLIQQFYEESLATNLQSWGGTWIKIRTGKETVIGKINNVTHQKLLIILLKEKVEIELNQILTVHSLRFFSLLSFLGKKKLGLLFK